MIDFSDKAQLGCFIGVVSALACLAAALIVMTARMKKRFSGGAFAAWLTAAIIVVVAGIAACLISIIFKTEFLKLDCEIVGGALSIVHDGNTLFTVPGLGVFFGVAFEHAVIELLMYGVTLLALALVALTCIRRGVSRAVWSRDVDGEGYYVVSGDVDEQSAFEPIETETSDDENAAQPENAETAEKESAEEPETAEIAEKEAAIEPEETEVKPIETVDEPEAAEEKTIETIEEPEVAVEEPAAAEEETVVSSEPETEIEQPEVEVEEPEAAEEKTIETVEEPEAAEEEEVVSPQPKPTEEPTDAAAPVESIEVEEPTDATALVEPIEVKEPTDATAPTEPIAAETPAENKPTAAKRHRAVKSRAAQVFGEYLGERSEEDREKLLGKIDIITKRTD